MLGKKSAGICRQQRIFLNSLHDNRMMEMQKGSQFSLDRGDLFYDMYSCV